RIFRLCPHPPASISFLLFPCTPSSVIYALSLHDALPICRARRSAGRASPRAARAGSRASSARGGNSTASRPGRAPETDSPDAARSEEHTSELQSRENLVCRLLLEKKKKTKGSSLSLTLRY